MRSTRGQDERGAVTAELALGLPLLMVVTWALAWLLSVVAVQIRTVDAAREAARAVARGDPPADAVAVARRVAPAGAAVRIDQGDPVVVRVTVEVGSPASSLLGGFSVSVEAEAVALSEDVAPQAPDLAMGLGSGVGDGSP